MNRKNIYYWLLLPVLALIMGACSESNNNEEPAKPDTPVTPVDPGDWQTVPAAGGTIEKGDIALTFPAGTFSSDTKVAITEVKKGEMGGDLEASPFYQITMPATTAKPVTVSVTCADTDEDISYIIRTPGWAPSLLKEVQHDNYLETNYAKGKYTTTLPVCDNGKDPGNESFTIGLGHVPSLEDDGGKATTRSSWTNKVLKSGTVDGVTWEIYMSWGAWSRYDYDFLYQVKRHTDQVAECIEEVIKQIHKLGFKLNGTKRTIPYYYSYLPDDWGAYERDKLNNNCSCIHLSCEKIAVVKSVLDPMPIDLRQTLIHETLHYYQADYDPIYWNAKDYLEQLLKGENDAILMHEMGAVWIEKYMNDGKLNAEFQIKDGLGGCIEKNYRLGFPTEKKDIVALFPNTKKPYQTQGYAMAPLLYYMTESIKDDDRVVTLYNLWRAEGDILGNTSGKTTVERLEEWYDSTFGFFKAANLDNYYLSLFKGDIMEDISIANNIVRNLREATKLENTLGKDSLKGMVYPNGCEGKVVCLYNFKASDIEECEFVVKQKEKGVHTQLLCYDGETKVVQLPGKAMGNDSIVVDGGTLASMMAKIQRVYLFLLTTRDEPYFRDKGTVPTNTWFELRKPTLPSPTVSPTELTFEAEGGTQESKITAPGFSYFGVSVDKAYSSWLSATPAKGGKVAVTAMANTTSEERIGYVKCYVANKADAPESEWVWLTPIKVTQKAGDASQQQQITQVEISSFKFKTGLYANCTHTHYNEKGKIDKTEEYVSGSSFEGGYMDQSFTAENFTSSFSGSTLHVKAEYEYRGQKYDVSFDVTGITGDYKEARVTSLTCKRVIFESVFGHEMYNFTATYSNIPVDKIGKRSASDPLSLSRMTFEGTLANGMGISGYSCEKYTNDGWGGYTHYHFDYLDNAANFATLEIDFKSVK